MNGKRIGGVGGYIHEEGSFSLKCDCFFDIGELA